MGKASKWIRNLLMGKREDKAKKSTVVTLETRSPTPTVRRRWSFKRSSSCSNKLAIITHKTAKSLDEHKTPINYAMLLALNAHAAATKIQAAYRSYLARRALRALKGLVKLQALTRGHLVRKQMNGVVRSMQTAMAIQVRARIQRIQMAQRESLSASDRDKIFSQDNTNRFPKRSGSSLRSRSGRDSSTGRVSVEYQRNMSQSPSKYEWSSTNSAYDGQLDEESSILKMTRREYSGRYYAGPETKHHRFMVSPSLCPADCIPSDSQSFVPNYMSNTRSSEAKARAHSEPRQRPRSKGTRSSSIDAKINDHRENQQYPWLAASPLNLY